MENIEKETINIVSYVLKKILYQSLIIGANQNSTIIMGIFGGKIKNNQVFIDGSFAIGTDNRTEANWQEKVYLRCAQYDSQLEYGGKFVIGWYCSIQNEESLFNLINQKTQLTFQERNKNAIVITLYPGRINTKSFEQIIKVYRLKDVVSSDYSKNNWRGLRINVRDRDKDKVMIEIYENYKTLVESIDNCNKFKTNEKLNDYLDNWIIHDQDVTQIKNYFLEVGTKFSRLHLDEISEKFVGKDRQLIINTISNMIQMKQLSAIYFKSSNFIAFDIRENLRLLESAEKKSNMVESKIKMLNFKEIEKSENINEKFNLNLRSNLNSSISKTEILNSSKFQLDKRLIDTKKNNNIIKDFNYRLSVKAYFSILGTGLKYINRLLSHYQYRIIIGLLWGFVEDNNVVIMEAKEASISEPFDRVVDTTSNDLEEYISGVNDFEKDYRYFVRLGWYKIWTTDYKPSPQELKSHLVVFGQNPLSIMLICRPLDISTTNPAVKLIRPLKSRDYELVDFKIDFSKEDENISFSKIVKKQFPSYF